MKQALLKRRGGMLVLTAMCAVLAVLLLASPKPVGDGVRAGLRLCGDVIIPSLFPFMVLAGFVATSRVCVVLERILLPLTYLLRLPARAGAPLLMGLIGGYPVGARTLSIMVGQKSLDKDTASRMLCFCVNAGPPFLLCAVGAGMFRSLQVGGLLLVAQLLSTLVIGIVLGLFEPSPESCAVPQQGYRPYSTCFVQAVNDACTGMFSICAFVVLFSAITSLITATGAAGALTAAISSQFPALGKDLINGILFGALEVTTGCRLLGRCGYSGMLAAAALLSFSGLSVVFQVMAAVHGSGISVRGFVLSRVVHALLTLGVFAGLLHVFPQAEQVALSLSQPVEAYSGTVGSSASLLAMCAVFLLTYGSRNATGTNRIRILAKRTRP